MAIRLDTGYTGAGLPTRPATSGNEGGKTASSPSSATNTETLPVLTIRAPATKYGSETRIVSQSEQSLDNGYRKTLTYEKSDGSLFSKIEEFSLTENGARRLVTQQNPSGSVTRYEEVLDRENNGSGNFRRIQRFQDASGEISTQVTSGYTSEDPYILSKGAVQRDSTPSGPFSAFRGTQLDLQA